MSVDPRVPADFTDRVMRAVVDTPRPSPTRAFAHAVAGRSLTEAHGALSVACRLLRRGTVPMTVRAQALALLVVVTGLASGGTALAAVAAYTTIGPIVEATIDRPVGDDPRTVPLVVPTLSDSIASPSPSPSLSLSDELWRPLRPGMMPSSVDSRDDVDPDEDEDADGGDDDVDEGDGGGEGGGAEDAAGAEHADGAEHDVDNVDGGEDADRPEGIDGTREPDDVGEGDDDEDAEDGDETLDDPPPG